MGLARACPPKGDVVGIFVAQPAVGAAPGAGAQVLARSQPLDDQV